MTQERQLGSHYTLGEMIGRGATGHVYAGTDREGNELAFKVLREELSEQDQVVDAFVTERRRLQSIHSPHVVQVHDLVAERDTLAVVMERVHGGDLRQALAQRGTYTPQEVATLGAQIATGLDAAHAAGIVHRDVKPENVLLARTPEGTVAKITDFGIAQMVESAQATRTTMMKGTVNYAAPEVINGSRGTAKTDVYSLGIALYEMTCGVTPFQGATTTATLHGHAALLPGRPDGVPDQLWTVLSAMMAKDPDHRPTAAEAADQLRQLAPQLAGVMALTPLTTPVPGTPVHAPAASTVPLQETQVMPPAHPAPAHTVPLAAGAVGAGTLGAPSAAHAASPEQPRKRGRGGCFLLGAVGVLLLGAAAVGVGMALNGDDEEAPEPAAPAPAATSGATAGEAQPSQDPEAQTPTDEEPTVESPAPESTDPQDQAPTGAASVSDTPQTDTPEAPSAEAPATPQESAPAATDSPVESAASTPEESSPAETRASTSGESADCEPMSSDEAMSRLADEVDTDSWSAARVDDSLLDPCTTLSAIHLERPSAGGPDDPGTHQVALFNGENAKGWTYFFGTDAVPHISRTSDDELTVRYVLEDGSTDAISTFRWDSTANGGQGRVVAGGEIPTELRQ